MGQKIYTVDAFTGEAFRGNPAAVCILEREAPEQWMRNVAAEMNLSETAFLFRENGHYRLRWFTPSVEVKLCGHATLGTAHVLWEEGHLEQGEQARFETLSGTLTADKEDNWIKLDFPAKVAMETAPPKGLLESLAIKNPVYVGKNAFDYIVEVENEEIIAGLKPDMGLLATVEARGVIVTAKANGVTNPSATAPDFISRFFAPAAGVNEDPVTGSAHCCLTPYWSGKLGKTDMFAYQASARGGRMRVALRGDR
ncbi:MAG TPA: PhzF family phenazine biosynthesis protein, partial [Longimicrobiales bacterium]|nr:PhzF family phenazine biosynthesis protein [Longimicrobiales bacterium]